MRVKNFLLMFFVLMFLASLAMVSVPVQSSVSPVTFYVDTPAQGYISGVAVDTTFGVDIIVDASGLTPNSTEGIAGWGIDVQVDPTVLEVVGAVGAAAGYYMYDFLVDYNYNDPPWDIPYPVTLFVGSKDINTGYMDEITEQVVPTPEGGAGSTGILVSLAFKSKSLTEYSPIQIGLYQEGSWQSLYMDANGVWHDAVTIDGHYNAPPFSYLHSVSSLIDLSSPVTSSWHELYPGYSNVSSLNNWVDGQSSDEPGYGELSPCDSIQLNTTWYHVEGVTVTIETRHPTETEELVSTESPSSTSGGWTNGTDAFADGGGYANITAAKPSASQYYGGYGFDIPSGATITQVRVRLDAWTNGNEYLRLKVSADGGSDWLASEGEVVTTLSETTYWIDVTGWTSWTAANITNDNIRTQVWTYQKGGGGGLIDVFLDWIPIEVTYLAPLPVYIEYLPGYMHMDDAIDDANLTLWHEVYPVFSQWYNLTGWADNDASGNLTFCDDFDLTNLTDLTTETYHVEGVHTDIIISGPIPSPPEFPLGLAVEIGLIVAIAYVWWRSRRKTKITKQAKPAYRPHQ